MFKVGFSRSKHWYAIGSLLIQKAEARNFSHAYIEYVCPITNEVIISQASHGYVNEMNKDAFLINNIVVKEYELDCTSEQFINILKFIKKHLGTKYSKRQIIILSLKKLFHLNINENNYDLEFICSEWGARICKIIGIQVPDNLDVFTPSDLDRLLTTIKENTI